MSVTKNNFTPEEIEEITEQVREWIDAQPGEINWNDNATKTELRRYLAEQHGNCSATKFISIIPIALNNLGITIEKSNSTRVTVKRNVGDDPSASQSDAPDENDPPVPKKLPPRPTYKGVSRRGINISRISPAITSNKKSVAGASPILHNQVFSDTLSINVTGLPYNVNAKHVDKPFAEDASRDEALQDLINVFSSNNVDTFFEEMSAYYEYIGELTAAHPGNGGKDQLFKHNADYTKWTYTNDDGKAANLTDDEVEPLKHFMNDFMSIIYTDLAAFIKGGPKISSITYILTTSYVNSVNVLSYDVVKKWLTQPADHIKGLEFTLTIDNDDAFKLSLEQLDPLRASSTDMDYVMLFRHIHRLPTSKLSAVSKEIFLSRCRVLQEIPDKRKLFLWNQARSNIAELTHERILEEHENIDQTFKHLIHKDSEHIINCWQSILASKYMYAIIMLGVPENKIVNKALIKLVTHDTSILLAMTALHPIAFLFTPFHCWADKMIAANDITSKTKANLTKDIKRAIAQLQTSESFNLSAKNWLYVTNCQSSCENLMIKLLGSSIVSPPPVKKSATGTTTATGKAPVRRGRAPAKTQNVDEILKNTFDDGNEEEEEE